MNAFRLYLSQNCILEICKCIHNHQASALSKAAVAVSKCSRKKKQNSNQHLYRLAGNPLLLHILHSLLGILWTGKAEKYHWNCGLGEEEVGISFVEEVRIIGEWENILGMKITHRFDIVYEVFLFKILNLYLNITQLKIWLDRCQIPWNEVYQRNIGPSKLRKFFIPSHHT